MRCVGAALLVLLGRFVEPYRQGGDSSSAHLSLVVIQISRGGVPARPRGMTLSTLASVCWPPSVCLGRVLVKGGRLHDPGANRAPKRVARYEPVVRWGERRNLQRLFRQFSVSGKSAESQSIAIAGN